MTVREENTSSAPPPIDKQILIRILLMVFGIMLMLGVLLIRLWSIQILSGREFNERSERQYARNIRIPALRGRIFSADGRLLAGNRSSYCALLHLSEMGLSGRRKKAVEKILAEIRKAELTAGINSRITEKNILYHMIHYPGIPMVIFKDLNTAQMAQLAEITPPIRGLELTAEGVRFYPFGSLAAHVIGYTGAGDPKMAEDRAEYFYYLPDPAGKTGLEKRYDKLLKGKPGKKLVIVNHRGFVHEEVGTPEEARNGSDLILNLDAAIQNRAQKLLAGMQGAIAVMDASDGAVLALASAPDYNLNSFIPGIPFNEYRKLLRHPGKPFVNKALQGSYMPGSILKILLGLSLLENGVADVESKVHCDGFTAFSRSFRIRCWAHASGGHGPLSLTDALKVSCNDYFIENGVKLGMEKFCETLRSAGLGTRTGIGLWESPGLVPDRKKYRYWGDYDTALISIGQGKVLLTPVQAVSYAAAFCNGGTVWVPQLVREIRDPEGKVTRIRPVRKSTLLGSSENLERIRQGMYEAVNSPNGGVRGAKITEGTVYGKSGTAEVGPKNNRTKNTWFLGFCKTPGGRNLAICVLVISGRSGNLTAAPLAANLLRYIIRREPRKETGSSAGTGQ